MKNKAVIRNIKVIVGLDGSEFLDGFYIEGKGGVIDPFVDCGIELPDDMSADEQIEWARKQIGKTLFYGELQPFAWYTTGKTYIS